MLLFSVEPDEEDGEDERPSSGGIVIFTVVFLICLAVFAVAGILWWQQSTGTPLINFGGQTTTAAPTTQTTSRFGDYSRQTLAVYVTDNNGALQTVTLLFADPDRAAVTAAGLPSELSLSNVDGDTLAKRYALGGTEAAQPALAKALGVSVDHYLVLSYTQALNLLTTLGDDLIFTLTEDVNAQSADGSYAIHLTAGERALTPKQAANLLEYTDWQGGRRARAHAHAAILSAFVNQFLVSGRDGITDFGTLSQSSSTDVVKGDFYNAAEMLSYLAVCNQGSLCRTADTDGLFAGAGTSLCFTPSDAMLQALRTIFTAELTTTTAATALPTTTTTKKAA